MNRAISSQDCLKLSVYFGERQRADRRFLAEALLSLFGDRAVASSVMLRGIASFGPRQHLRTDTLLSLSEDPPVTIAAVDTREKIDALVEEVVALTPRGLITLERAALAMGNLEGLSVPDGHDEVKLTIFVGRRQRVGGAPAHQAICDVLYREGMAGARVFLGVDGTTYGERHRANFFSRNVDVPVMIIAVGEVRRIAGVTAELTRMLTRPLMTVERIRVCKRGGTLIAPPHRFPDVDERGVPVWQKLMVYTRESDLHDGQPIHRALVQQLRQSGAASGATVLRSIWGFQGDKKPHGDRFFQLARQVPVMTVVVDTPERIARSFEIVDELTADFGVVTSELVPALLLVDGDKRTGSMTLATHRY